MGGIRPDHLEPCHLIRTCTEYGLVFTDRELLKQQGSDSHQLLIPGSFNTANIIAKAPRYEQASARARELSATPRSAEALLQARAHDIGFPGPQKYPGSRRLASLGAGDAPGRWHRADSIPASGSTLPGSPVPWCISRAGPIQWLFSSQRSQHHTPPPGQSFGSAPWCPGWEAVVRARHGLGGRGDGVLYKAASNRSVPACWDNPSVPAPPGRSLIRMCQDPSR